MRTTGTFVAVLVMYFMVVWLKPSQFTAVRVTANVPTGMFDAPIVTLMHALSADWHDAALNRPCAFCMFMYVCNGCLCEDVVRSIEPGHGEIVHIPCISLSLSLSLSLYIYIHTHTHTHTYT
jgi:hypothetical protein